MMGYRTTTENGSARRRTFLVLFAVLFAAGGLATWLLTRPKPTIEQRIAEAFRSAQAAAQKGDISGTVAVISDDFRAGSLTKRQLRLILFRSRQQAASTDWDVEVAPPRVLAAPDNAPNKRLVITRIVARDATSGGSLWSSGDAPITLLMREEPTRIWGIFPSSAWRVVSAPSIPSF